MFHSLTPALSSIRTRTERFDGRSRRRQSSSSLVAHGIVGLPAVAWLVGQENVTGWKAATQCAEPASQIGSTQSKENVGPTKQKQTIALLGATGHTGKHVLQQALARGHRVKALVRDPAKLKKQEGLVVAADQDQLEIVQGNATDEEAIRRLIQNADVVVSCLGGTSRTDTIQITTATNLLQVMGPSRGGPSASSPRLVMMTSLGCAGTSPTVKFGLSCLIGFKHMNAMDEADRMIREGATFGYVIVRPPRIDTVPKGTGKYNATTAYPWLCPIACGIAYQDVATFILDAVEDDKWDGNGVQLYSA